MGFVDRKILLCNGVSVPTSGLAPTCGDIIDMGPGTRSMPIDDMYLVVFCSQSFTDDASGTTPSFVIGVSTMDTAPTGVTATDAVALNGAGSRVFQYGNIDLGLGLASVGIAGAVANEQTLVGRLTHLPAITVGRYMGLWIAMSGLTTAETGPFSVPTAGKLSAYLTSVPPSGRRLYPNGF